MLEVIGMIFAGAVAILALQAVLRFIGDILNELGSIFTKKK